jgi:DNA polymerase-4
VPSRFDAYKEASKQIREVFYEYTDLVEPLSLDEAYLDVTHNHVGNPSATLIAREIKKKIYERTKLTASAGVGPNKFVAKVASDMDKPNGLTVIPPDKMDAFLEDLPIKKFYGVGKATLQKMLSLGIQSGRDLKQWELVELVRIFGKSGHYYYRMARGEDTRPVQSHRIRKSYGKERTFSEDVSDRDYIHQFIEGLSATISEGMRAIPAAGKTITLKLRYENFETITRSLSLNHHTNDAKEISAVSKQLLQETAFEERSIRLLGISLSNLDINEDYRVEQLQLGLDAR